MCVLYLTKHDCQLQKNGGQVVVRESGQKVAGVPIKMVDTVIVAANAQISTQLIFALLQNGTQIIYTDWRGAYQGSINDCRIGIEKLELQSRVFNNPISQLRLGKYVIAHKLENQIKLLRDYNKHQKNTKLREIINKLLAYREKIIDTQNIEELRGFEGICSKIYFSAFSELLPTEAGGWAGRSRQPALNPVNALLNYGYAFLERDIRIAILGNGLDERIGFLHSNNGRKDSLVYDLMEMFRQSIVDKFVLRLFNRKVFQDSDFQYDGEGCLLTEKARKEWIRLYEEYMASDEDKSLRNKLRKEVAMFKRNFIGTVGLKLAN